MPERPTNSSCGLRVRHKIGQFDLTDTTRRQPLAARTRRWEVARGRIDRQMCRLPPQLPPNNRRGGVGSRLAYVRMLS